MNYLSICANGKGIPYFPDSRDDGERNYGFRCLKGKALAVAEIPEIASDQHLHDLLLAANNLSTGIFTVGCLSGSDEEEAGFRRTGYVEFALNSVTAVVDPAAYFPAFFHFDRLWKRESHDLRAVLNWELQPAFFHDFGIDGYTCAVTINTHFYPSQHEANRCWDACLDLLAALLSSIPAKAVDDRLY